MASAASMPAATADLQTTWAFLEDGVDHIMTKLQTGVSYSKVSLVLPLVVVLTRATVHVTIYGRV
jgi:hypothetical protein